jgi:hypothetical protein
MYKELNQFIINDVWELVPCPNSHNIIGAKWIFKNKSDEHGTIIKNKERLRAQWYTQVEGINFDEIFVLVACLESVSIMVAIVCHLNFKLYQMDTKNTFVNGIL